ncbi:MAG: helix-turn-helix domain-containing protein [Bryobacteraceae bacterium]
MNLQMRKQQLVREAILDAALTLFEEKGFEEATVDEIAERAGVSRRSFFRYFGSKSDLMGEGVTRHGETLLAAIAACSRKDSLGAVFRRTVTEVARVSVEDVRTVRIMRIAAQYPEARAAQLSRMPEVQERIAAGYARHWGGKRVDGMMCSIVAGLTLSTLAVAFRAYLEQGQRDIGKITERIFATLGQLVEPGK